MRDANPAKGEHSLLKVVLTKLGTADVCGFGLIWEDGGQILRQLGYPLRIEASQVA